MTRRCLVTGIAGQDGSYLAEQLSAKGYEVHGMEPDLAAAKLWRLKPVRKRIKLMKGDITDPRSTLRAVRKVAPDEVYHLAAPSSVAGSYRNPRDTIMAITSGTEHLLRAVESESPDARVFLASSSEMFGRPKESPQDERTPLSPVSPYGSAKTIAHLLGAEYRESRGLFVCSGILYNHESPRRTPEFVTRKISLGVARIARGLQKRIELGNLDSRRDWGYAPEYTDAMWRMLQQGKPEDYVVATGETHTVREFVSEACRVAGVEDPERIVTVRKEFFREEKGKELRGNPSKAKRKLHWSAKTGFRELVRMMVEADLGSIDG